ncbi:hypothetical protein [Bradyrhizobium tunisiense]|uniref:hypothetical protein n=1 Tax=Bradyrhizobium tunisiense TaxID=3278709 RepID=UPI0035E31733
MNICALLVPKPEPGHRELVPEIVGPQGLPDRLAVDPFADDVAARYGVKLNGNTRAGNGIIEEKRVPRRPRASKMHR